MEHSLAGQKGQRPQQAHRAKQCELQDKHIGSWQQDKVDCLQVLR